MKEGRKEGMKEGRTLKMSDKLLFLFSFIFTVHYSCVSGVSGGAGVCDIVVLH